MRSRSRISAPARGRPALVGALGTISALALAATGTLPLGDPVARADATTRADADVAAREVRLAWEQVRTSTHVPGAVDVLRFTWDEEEGPPPRSQGTSSDGPSADRAFDVLVHSALTAEAAGDLEAARDNLVAALERRPGSNHFDVARLHALRIASRLGDAARVDALRTEIRESAHPESTYEGTSVRLLADLVPPVDARVAATRLMDRSTPLPPPNDTLGPDLEFEPDPWWQAIRARVEEGADPVLLDLAMDVADRHRDLLRQVLAPADDPSRWTFDRVGDVIAAHRTFDSHWSVVRLDDATLVRAIGADTMPRVTIGAEGSLPAAELDSEPEPLPGADLSFTIRRDDALAIARPEIVRLRLVRAGLFALSALVLAATVLAMRAMRRAARLAELRSTFVASVSHDLRTPTQAILLLAETLEDGRVATDAARANYHSRIRREAQRLRRMVEDLLDGARIDRGAGSRIARREVDVRAFVEELEARMNERATEAGAELIVTRQSLPGVVHVDPDGVHRAVWNLFENALAHGVTEGAPPRIEVAFEFADDTLTVNVADDGPGIPARYLETVFDPFERLRDRSKRKGLEDDTGTGLGLAIVRAIARAHGGDAVARAEERGARFVVTIPATEEETEAA